MLGLADVIVRHGPDYLARHGSVVPQRHVRALSSIARCRTGALGGHLAVCTACGREHVLPHSCHHRACPRCGHDATRRWLERQRELLLPVPYFHVVFTLPAELRRPVRQHQQALIGALFRAAFDALAALCADPQWLGGHIGALAVLHTWTRTLEWHPHVHLLMPAGGLAPDGLTWLAPPRRKQPFLVPEPALAELFRGRFLHLARRAVPGLQLPHIPWDKRWVVFAKPVAHPGIVLDYLARYVHRTALSDKAITACDHRSVTFNYRDSGDGQRKAMTLPAHEFLRRFLQHVPLRGLHRVRAFGLLHPTERTTLGRLQLLLASRNAAPVNDNARRFEPLPCPHCHERTLRLVRRLSADECAARLAAGAPSRPSVLARGPPLSSAGAPPP
jgi:predicted RNA-binding Zn-ribbon protein involved in translation (DUF1610 family)